MKRIIFAILVLGLILFVFFMPRLFSNDQKSTFSIGKMDDFPSGTIRLISSAKVLVIADREGIYAISAVCTHKGCLIREAKDGFLCPCHAAQFDLNGKVVRGPAKDNLAWYSLESDEQGNLTLNTSKTVSSGTKLERPVYK